MVDRGSRCEKRTFLIWRTSPEHRSGGSKSGSDLVPHLFRLTRGVLLQVCICFDRVCDSSFVLGGSICLLRVIVKLAATKYFVQLLWASAGHLTVCLSRAAGGVFLCSCASFRPPSKFHSPWPERLSTTRKRLSCFPTSHPEKAQAELEL
jgi:hypothetical protein